MPKMETNECEYENIREDIVTVIDCKTENLVDSKWSFKTWGYTFMKYLRICKVKLFIAARRTGNGELQNQVEDLHFKRSVQGFERFKFWRAKGALYCFPLNWDSNDEEFD